ncbi:MAG: HNH endonuclease, partial [Gammaproteobacteria bacterium]|nr:HNH endonuclease [Gammaproteobacteria bacterium]
GSSLPHRNYAKHLIDRYHEFKTIDVGKENMKHAIFYQKIKRKFGAKWDMMPLEKFDDLVLFVQTRIDKTRHGRIRKANARKNYSEFGEYMEKYGGYGDV